jgi:hypothetical protein
LIDAYLRLHGPATRSDVAGFLGTKPGELEDLWPDDLAEVRVGTRKAWLPSDQVEALVDAEPDDEVRLLPHADPMLQSRDREVLVPDAGRRKAVWPVLGGPGIVFAGGDAAGSWRSRTSGSKRLDLLVDPWTRLTKAVKAGIEAEAERVAAVRGRSDVRVVYG